MVKRQFIQFLNLKTFIYESLLSWWYVRPSQNLQTSFLHRIYLILLCSISEKEPHYMDIFTDIKKDIFPCLAGRYASLWGYDFLQPPIFCTSSKTFFNLKVFNTEYQISFYPNDIVIYDIQVWGCFFGLCLRNVFTKFLPENFGLITIHR